MNEQELLDAALQINDLKKRKEFLQVACGEDADLRGRVEQLIHSHLQVQQILAKLPVALNARTTMTLDANTIVAQGNTIAGRYKLLEKIGEGGMGTVWIAEQREPVKRTVAIKLVKAGMDSKQVLARFEAERQALALMDHPNIAKVFDGAMTEAERPFFVMEYVKGVPLTDYCDQARLSVRERLQLFIQVCQAVQHAHQKGVIHRDLKPSNILVCLYDGKPVPKVIDFGLAKAMHQSLTDETLHTALGVMVGTPLYMSPEQAEHNNLDVDTRTDIYSLGVILYELLTGSTPLERLQLKQAAYQEILRLIKEVEPPKPSTRLSSSASLPSVAEQRRVDPNQLRKTLAGDLDWIVMKALDKERSRRYETANGFARDVERYLNDETVEATPPTAGYRLRKLVRKHRAALTTSVAFVLVLLAGTVVSVWQAIRATTAELMAKESLKKEQDQRNKAEFAERVALEALASATDESIDQLIGSKPQLGPHEKQYLENALKRWQAFANGFGGGQLELVWRAEGHYRIGSIWRQLGNREEAHRNLSEAVDLYRMLVRSFPNEWRNRQGQATVQREYALLLDELGKQDEAELQHRESLSIYQSLAKEFPDSVDTALGEALHHGSLGVFLTDRRKDSEAEEQYRHALSIYEALAKKYPADLSYQSSAASIQHNLGVLFSRQLRYEDSERQYRLAVETASRVAQNFPNEATYREVLAHYQFNLGQMLNRRDRTDEAQELYKDSFKCFDELASKFPSMPEYRSELADILREYGTLIADRQILEIPPELKKSVSLLEDLVRLHPDVPVYQFKLAMSHARIGSVSRVKLGDSLGALEHFYAAEKIAEKLTAKFPKESTYWDQLLLLENWIGDALNAQGKTDLAAERYLKAIGNLEKLVSERPGDRSRLVTLAGYHCNYGAFLVKRGQLDDSVPWFSKAIDVLTPLSRQEPEITHAKNFLRNSHVGRATAFSRLTRRHEELSDWDKAVELSPPDEQSRYRLRRAFGYLKINKKAEAMQELEIISPHADWSSVDYYDLACLFAIGCAAINEKHDDYALKAVEMLRNAVNAGWSNAAHIRNDTDLDPIRDRVDFKQIVETLEKAPAQVKPIPLAPQEELKPATPQVESKKQPVPPEEKPIPASPMPTPKPEPTDPPKNETPPLPKL